MIIMPGMKKQNLDTEVSGPSTSDTSCKAFVQGLDGLKDARYVAALIRAARARQEAPLPGSEEDAWDNAASVLRARSRAEWKELTASDQQRFTIDSDDAPRVLAAMGYTPLRVIRED